MAQDAPIRYVFPNMTPRVQFHGTIHWTCPDCGHCHHTHIKPPNWLLRCKKRGCGSLFGIAFTFREVPKGPRRDPPDITIPAPMLANASVSDSEPMPIALVALWKSGQRSQIVERAQP